MLIWARESEVDIDFKDTFERLFGEIFVRQFKPWEFSIILRQIKRHFGDRCDISILDFGAGESPFGAYLNHLGYEDVTCLDKVRGWHRRMNNITYNRRYGSRVKYVKADITLNEYDGEHDVILSASVLEHIPDEARIEVMRSLFRHLKPGGLIIHVIDYDPKNKEGVNVKELIDNCGISISYKPEEMPGCKEFISPPEYAWWLRWKKKRKDMSRVAFFNEKEV